MKEIKLKWERSWQGYTTLYLYDKDGKKYEMGFIEEYPAAEANCDKDRYVFGARRSCVRCLNPLTTIGTSAKHQV